MDLNGKRIGFGVTGSFCTIGEVLPAMQALIEAGAQVFPIFSPAVGHALF